MNYHLLWFYRRRWPYLASFAFVLLSQVRTLECESDGLDNVNNNELTLLSDPKCNSERLRSVIQAASGQDTSIIKRNIQLMAEQRLNARYNVICAEDDFSYITNTEEFCQDVVQGRTCYVFKQYIRDAATTGGIAAAAASPPATKSASAAAKRYRRRRRKFFHL